MKKIWLLYPDTTPQDSNAFGWFRDSFARYGLQVEILFWNGEGVIEGLERYPLPQVAIMRGYHSDLSRTLETFGVRVINSTDSMAACRDKRVTARILTAKGIPTPRIIPQPDSFPFVIKSPVGSKGEEVFLVEDAEQLAVAREHLRGLEPFCQEYIATSCGRDIRVWVIGGEVVGGLLRSNEHSFKSNFAQGGNASSIILPQEVKELAVAATEALGLDFAGVDILFGGGKYPPYLVCEVNGNAGFRTASIVGGMDIPLSLAAYVDKILRCPYI